MFKPSNKSVAVSSCLALAVLLAGCANTGGGTSPGSGEAGGEPAAAPKPPTEPVELTIYSAGGTQREEFNKNYGDYIAKKFPHVRVQYINPRDGDAFKFENLLLMGVNVDLYYESIGTFFSTLPRTKTEFDLTPLIKQYGVDLTRFEPTLIEALRQNGQGQIWGLPVTTNGMSLYYNKDLFDKFGVPYLKDGMTWEQVYETAAKLDRKDGDKTIAGIAVSPSHSTRMNPYSVPFVDPQTMKATFADERWKSIVEPILKPAANANYRAKMDELEGKLPYSGEWLTKQELAIFGVFSDWQVVSPTPVPFEWDIAAYPTTKEMPGVGSQQYPVYWSIPKTAKHKEQAFEVLNYLVSDEYQLELSRRGGMTVLNSPDVKKAFGQNSLNKHKNLAAAYYNKFAPISPKTEVDKTAENELIKRLPDLAYGRTDINTALRQAAEEANKAIEAMKR
ncbi:ABC transporter substrate-binding protein [Paenibacillus sp. GYB003]|uniref:ABC transporter substrate-binding protein n=1 Tax=Paenibacillus sp. GYB003 TaxID=2994392 RepID=UPI002F961D1D